MEWQFPALLRPHRKLSCGSSFESVMVVATLSEVKGIS